MSRYSLVVVGLGIKFLSHISAETKTYLEQSDKLLYLVNEPLTKEWIEKINPHTESLEPIYVSHPRRLDSYRAITLHILKSLDKFKLVCVALYGHPAVFAQPALDAVKKAKEKGLNTKILPAISAEDCLFADLLIDPGSCGCQSFEATDFLIHKRRFDTNSHLILWQVGIIGNLNHVKVENISHGIFTLVNFLRKFYSLKHKVILYEAALYPEFEPRIEEVLLEELINFKLSRIATLYIPPVGKSECDSEILNQLNITLENLQ